MSRARPLGLDANGDPIWWDQKRNSHKATAEQLELLAAAENIPIDDLLDEGLSQGQAQFRLRLQLNGDVIPAEILERRRARREEAAQQPVCRICDHFHWVCEGQVTRHHFVPRWMMLMLDKYQTYSARTKCTIPACVGRHRDFHLRGDTQTPKSIIPYLTPDEAALAEQMLLEFKEQHPYVFDLIMGGDESTYEYQLLRDFSLGRFREAARDTVSVRVEEEEAVGAFA